MEWPIPIYVPSSESLLGPPRIAGSVRNSKTKRLTPLQDDTLKSHDSPDRPESVIGTGLPTAYCATESFRNREVDPEKAPPSCCREASMVPFGLCRRMKNSLHGRTSPRTG